MRISKSITYLIILLTVGGCAGRLNKKMDSWIGHHYSELIESWGAPAQILDDGKGGKVLVYTDSFNYTTPTYNVVTGNQTGAITTTQENSRMFWANERGIIYKWKRK